MSARPRLIVLACVAALFAWFFSQAILDDRSFAFRDAADFYYPLFQAIQSQWTTGSPPLWNPYDNLGLPLAASPTASVWYPGKLLFWLPLGFDWNYKLYITLHVLLAAATAYRLARRWQASETAAGVAALSYAFGGHVLYQYTNVVFLIAAAWLPCALAAASQIAGGRRVAGAIGLAATLTLMVLGGDPQTAYHAAILAVAYVGLGIGKEKQNATIADNVESAACGFAEKSRLRDLAFVLTAGALAALLSAVQLLPSWEFSTQSDRAVTANARSLYEIPQALRHDDPGRRIAAGLLCRFDDDCPHHAMAFEFSVGPWRLVELAWPNVSGRQFPEHRRWLDALPDERQIWTPSLYQGLLPLLLALSQFGLRRGESRARFLSWMLLAATLASFGAIGPGWLVRRIAGLFGGADAVAAAVGDPVGGVYWLLTVLLPGYVDFRYPAKWMTVAALALSLLAARGWDAAAKSTECKLAPWFRRLAATSLIAAVGFIIVRPWWCAWLEGAAPNPLFGPLDTPGAAHDLLWALVQCGLLAFLFARQWRRIDAHPAWSGVVCLTLLTIDLGAANGWLVVTAPTDLWRETPRLAKRLTPDELGAGLSLLSRSENGTVPLRYTYPPRIYRHWIWLPSRWQRTRSPNRFEEALQWSRATLAPQHHLTLGCGQVETYGTMMYGDFRFLIQAAETALGTTSDEQPGWIAAPLADLLGVEYAIAPDVARLGKADPLDQESLRFDERSNVQIGVRSRRLPRAWIVHDVELRAPLVDSHPQTLARRSREVLQLAAAPAAALQRAIVETAGPWPPAAPAAAPPAAAVETCRLEDWSANRVVIAAALARPGLVVLSEQYDRNWRALVESDGLAPRPVDVFRVDRVLRGVWLPAGQHRIAFEYRPRSVVIGAVVSGSAWLLLAVGLVLHRSRNRRRPHSSA